MKKKLSRKSVSSFWSRALVMSIEQENPTISECGIHHSVAETSAHIRKKRNVVSYFQNLLMSLFIVYKWDKVKETGWNDNLLSCRWAKPSGDDISFFCLRWHCCGRAKNVSPRGSSHVVLSTLYLEMFWRQRKPLVPTPLALPSGKYATNILVFEWCDDGLENVRF